MEDYCNAVLFYFYRFIKNIKKDYQDLKAVALTLVRLIIRENYIEIGPPLAKTQFGSQPIFTQLKNQEWKQKQKAATRST